MSSGVRVAVRVRPFNSREKERNAECIVKMSGNKTVLTRPASLRSNPTAAPSADDEKSFTFDHSYWSFDADDNNFAGQQVVFDDLGREVLQNAWEGFNCSIFAYGQTGSGKSYSMLGYGEDKGIIPLVCEEMFKRINNTTSNEFEQTVFKVEVSFMEIYNERVKDLLNPKNNKVGGLKVRNHPTTGPYVEDLSKLAVKSFQEIEMLMDEGSKARTVASTNMNATSSRSHAVFTIVFTQSKIDKKRGVAVDRVSKVSLVDLAGSERANSTGATGMRLKEGANINKSLSTLGKVISALAENSSNPTKKQVFVPYRDSVLTYLLKESLGGNSKTIMIAAISPADINYEETLSTLRYADSAKKIKTTATVNEDPQSKVIRELQTEVERLKQQLLSGGGSIGSDSRDDDGLVLSLNEKIESYEKLMAELNKSWEEKLTESERIREERMTALKDMGVAIKVVSSIPHLINLNEDPLMSESLIYYLKDGFTRIGRSDADIPQDIILNGLNIAKEHCVIQNKDGVVTIIPFDDSKDNRTHSSVYVNGNEITSPTKISTGNRVILGNNHIFRFNHPEEAARIAKERSATVNGSSSPPIQSESDQIIDYDFALNELTSAQGNLAISKNIGDKKEFQRQMKALYEQMKKQLELDFQDPETKERRDRIAIIAVRRWRSKVFRTRLLNRISHLILQLNEANAISETFAKHIDLSLYLYSIFPQPDQISDSDEIDIDWRMTQIGIKVIKKDIGLSTMISSEEFVDRVYSMRELYQNDGRQEEGIEDPFAFKFDEPSLIGVSHIYLKNLLYLIDVKRAVPILDQNGSLKGYLNIALVPKSKDVSEEERALILESQENNLHDEDQPPQSQSPLLDKQLDITVQFNGITDFKEEQLYQNYFTKFNFINQTYQSSVAGSSLQLKDEKSIEIDSLSVDDISYLESEYIAFEVWGKKIKGEKLSPSENALNQPISESFEMMASINILEPEGATEIGSTFKPVHILEDSDNNMPSVTFRLRKEVTTRQVVLKFIKLSDQLSIKDCKVVKITNTRIIGKPHILSSTSNTPATPSTPNNARQAPSQPQTPSTPFGANGTGSNNLYATFNSTPNERGNSSFMSNSASKEALSSLLDTPSNSSFYGGSAASGASSSSFIAQSTALSVISVRKDCVIAEWTTSANDAILSQKTRKGSKLLFKITFAILFDGLPEEVYITKDVSVKVLSDNLQGLPEGANTSMSNLLDKFKTHFKGESIISEPSILHAGSVFNVHLTKSRQLEHQNRIGDMIDRHQENYLKLGYAMKMEKLRQELDLRERLAKFNGDDGTSIHSNSLSNNGSSESTITEEIIRKMSLINETNSLNQSKKKSVASSANKKSTLVVEVKVNEIGSSALIKEDEIKGYLKKKSTYKDEWKQRFFVWKKPYLYYSHGEKDHNVKNKKIDLTNASISTIPQEEILYGFAIIQLRRVWLLQASSNEQREKWMQILDPTRKISESKDAELRNVKKEFEKSSSLLETLKSQLETEQRRAKELDAQLEVTKKERDSIDSENKQLKTKSEGLNGEVRNLTYINDNKENQIVNLSETLDNTSRIMDMLTEQSRNYKNVTDMEIDALRQETLDHRENDIKLSAQLMDCKTAIQALESNNRDKEDKIQYYKQSMENNNMFVELQHKNLQNLKDDQTLKQNQINALSQTVEQSTKTILQISDQYSESSKQNEHQVASKTEELSQMNNAYQGESNKLKEQTVQLNSLSTLLRSQMKAFETSQSLQKEQSGTEQKKLLLLLQDLESGLNKASQTITEQSNQNSILRKEVEENKKFKVECSQLDQQISMMKERLINSENQLIDRECENTLLQDKLRMWEEEIKIKDAKLGLLENNVKEVRAEYENGMAFSRELTNPNSAANKKMNRKSKALSAEEQMENMRESSIAHQTHNAFLNLQLQRLENEMRQQEKVYSDTINRIKRDLQQRNQQNIAFMKQQAGDEVVQKLQEVTATFEILKKKYFVSLVVAAKLQHSMMGNICNVDAYEMYEQSQQEHVLDHDNWPNWVAENISKKK